METDASFVAAGVDTHKDAHALCVIDALGRKVREGAFPATAAGYRDLADAIGAPGKCLVLASIYFLPITLLFFRHSRYRRCANSGYRSGARSGCSSSLTSLSL